MSSMHSKAWRRAIAASLALSGATCGSAWAQSPPATSTADRVIAFSIPAGSVTTALVAFGRQAGVQVSYIPSVAANLTTQGVSGTMTAEAGAERMLVGTGLVAHLAGRTLVVARPGASGDGGAAFASGAITLDPVEVEADAQSPIGPGVGFLATQTLTGSKTDTPLIEIPQSISVVTQDQMKSQATQTVGEALRYTPGVLAEEYGGTDLRLDRFMIRGFQGSMPFLDGLPTISRYTLLSPYIDPFSLDRIEVLRGPSSVLYGQNIPGGIVNAVSKRPTETAFGEFEVEGLWPQGGQASFDFGGPANKDGTVLYRFTGLYRNSETQVDQVNTERYFLAPAVTFAPDDNTTLTILANAGHSNDGVLAQNLPALGTLYPAVFGKIPTNLFIGEPDFNKVERSSYSIGYNFEHRFNDIWTVRQNLRYSDTTVEVQQIGTSGYVPGNPLELSRWTLGADAAQQNFAVDNQVQAEFKTFELAHKVLVGLDYFHSHDTWIERDGSASPLNVLFPVYGQPYTLPPVDFATRDTLNQTGLYAQDQIKWDRWTLTVGGRQDWAQTDTTKLLTATTIAQDDSAFTWRAGLVYEFDNGIAPYVSYSTSFQPVIGVDSNGNPLLPTSGTQYEAGVKYQPPGSQVFLTLAAFNLEQNNMPTLQPTPSNPYNIAQIGSVRIRGIEASAVGNLGAGLKLVAAYTYNDAEITADGQGNVGNTPKDVPANMASLWLDKTLEDGDLRGLGAGGGFRYVGDRFGNNANTLALPANLLWDAAIHYDRDNWRFALNAKNVFDTTYVATCDSVYFCYYGLRRTVVGSITYKW